jgi:quinol-cytochrome oxidoreductase complex cytochrome b subunit
LNEPPAQQRQPVPEIVRNSYKKRCKMGKHDSYRHASDDRQTRKPEIHPVWRGIGFIFMILIPIMSYYGALVLIQENNKQHWVPFPFDLIANESHILFKLIPDPYIHIKLILTVAIMFVLFSIFSLITFAINSAFGASRYGPYDVPPIDRPRHVRRAR